MRQASLIQFSGCWKFHPTEHQNVVPVTEETISACQHRDVVFLKLPRVSFFRDLFVGRLRCFCG